MVTVEEIWKEALPPDTALLAGSAQLGRQVGWVLVLKPRPPGLGAPRGEELILLQAGSLQVLDPHLTLARAIEALAAKAAAIAVRGEVSEEAIGEAEKQGIPLFQLPASTALATIERETLRFLAERRTEWYQRKHSALQDLTALAVQGKGLDAIARHMAESTEQAVTFEDEAGQVLAVQVPTSFPAGATALVQAIAEGQSSNGSGAPAMTYSIPASNSPIPLGDGLYRLTVPITGKQGWAGTASMFGPLHRLDSEARLILEAGATAGAIEMAREHAVLETVHRIQGDLVSDLVNGNGNSEDLERRARRLGYELDGSRVAIMFCPVPDDSGTETPPRDVLAALRTRLSRVLTTYDVQPPFHADEGILTVFYPLESESSPAAVKRVAERLLRDLSDAARRHQLYVGISRIHSGPDSFHNSFREARRALDLGRALAPNRSVTYFGDLGVYRVLFAMRETGEMSEFYNDMLGQLVRYDQEKNSELVATLDAYLCSNNASEVAVRLNLHRNSLLYRLRRIREITGLDLDDAETRLALHLALRIGEALRADVRP